MRAFVFDADFAARYGLDEAIVIEHLRFWIRKNRADRRNRNHGRWWTYSSVRAMAELFDFWNPTKIWRIIRSLEKQGVIRVGNYNKLPTDRTQWFAFIDEKAFLDDDPPGASEEAVSFRDSSTENAPINAGEGAEPGEDVSERNGSEGQIEDSCREMKQEAVAIRDGLSRSETTLPDKTTDFKNIKTKNLRDIACDDTSLQLVGAADSEDHDQRFDEFWDAYPRRNGKRLEKPKALKVWRRMSERKRTAALLAVANYATACERGLTLAKDAFRWLRDECWVDWTTGAVVPAGGRGQHTPYRDPDPAEYERVVL